MSPFANRAIKHGYRFEGGKLDDVEICFNNSFKF